MSYNRNTRGESYFERGKMFNFDYTVAPLIHGFDHLQSTTIQNHWMDPTTQALCHPTSPQAQEEWAQDNILRDSAFTNILLQCIVVIILFSYVLWLISDYA